MKKKIVFLTIILTFILMYTTNLIERNYVDYGLNKGAKPDCYDCFTGYSTYGFPFESIKHTYGGFTGGGIYIPQIGFLFNFVIYLLISFIISYLIFKRKTNNISKIS